MNRILLLLVFASVTHPLAAETTRSPSPAPLFSEQEARHIATQAAATARADRKTFDQAFRDLARQTASPSAVRSAPQQSDQERSTPQQPAPTSALPAGVQEVTLATSRGRHVGSTVTITRTSPVFVIPDQNRTPLRLLAAGSVATLLGTEGDWYHIEFDDPRWGRRVGFVAKGGTAVDSGQDVPMDLSIPGAKPKVPEPADLSVPGAKAKVPEPVDLSVPGAKAKVPEPVDLSITGAKPSVPEPMDLSIPAAKPSVPEPMDLSIPGSKPKPPKPVDQSIRDQK